MYLYVGTWFPIWESIHYNTKMWIWNGYNGYNLGLFFSSRIYEFQLWNGMVRTTFLFIYWVKKIVCFCFMEKPVTSSPWKGFAHYESLSATIYQGGHNVCRVAMTLTEQTLSAAEHILSPGTGFQADCKDFWGSWFDIYHVHFAARK